MTLEDKLESIKGKKIAIWCPHEWNALVLHSALKVENINNYWSSYGETICYDLEDNCYFMHCDYSYYKNKGYKIINFKDFINEYELPEIQKIKLADYQIAYILDEKYGKNNWIIKSEKENI